MRYLDYLLNEMVDELSSDNLFTEKATTEEYHVSKFKKKYHYDPQKKTIIVNGETYKVDLDNYKSGIAYVKDVDGNKVGTIRQTFVDMTSSDPMIHFDRSFFKNLNSKQQDAIMQHEIGHSKLHSYSKNNQHLDKSAISSQAYNEYIKNIYRITVEQCQQAGEKLDSDDKKDILRSIKEEIPKEDYMNLSEDKRKAKIRDESLKIAKKYSKAGKVSHANTQEFEADRYAANRTSEKDLKRGVRKLYKNASKEKEIEKLIKNVGRLGLDQIEDGRKKINSMDWSYPGGDKQKEEALKGLEEARKNVIENKKEKMSKDNIKNMQKNQNKIAKIDYEQRSKALKDNQLRSSSVYK